MTNLTMKVILLFKAIAVLLLAGVAMVVASNWVGPFILPWDFVVYYGIGAMGVTAVVVLGAFFCVLKKKLLNRS